MEKGRRLFGTWLGVGVSLLIVFFAFTRVAERIVPKPCSPGGKNILNPTPLLPSAKGKKRKKTG